MADGPNAGNGDSTDSIWRGLKGLIFGAPDESLRDHPGFDKVVVLGTEFKLGQPGPLKPKPETEVPIGRPKPL